MQFEVVNLGELHKEFSVVTPDIEAAVEATITAALHCFATHFNRTFERPTVEYDLTGRTAGWSAHNGTIRLNKQLLTGPHYDDMLNRTIPHEVAHHVQWVLYPRSKPHGSQWAYLMFILGLPADRTHSYKTTPARKRTKPYTYYCACDTHKVSATIHRRIQQGRTYTCNTCKGRLHP